MSDEMDIRVIARNAAIDGISRYLSSPEASERINKLLENKASTSAEQAMRKLVGSASFQGEVEATYQAEIKSLIARSETRANRWAALAVAIFVIIFLAALSWQLAEARIKLSEVVMQHATAVDIVTRLNNTVEKFEKDITEKVSSLDSTISTNTTDVENFRGNVTKQMEGIETEITNLSQSLEELRSKR